MIAPVAPHDDPIIVEATASLKVVLETPIRF